MRRIFIFNGDADGLCALQQLRLAEGGESPLLVTGPKRRTELVKEAEVRPGDEMTVLDLSFKPNSAAVGRALEAGARVRYFDHHHAGDLPRHPRLEAHIDEGPEVCTSLIVDRYLAGAHRRWAVVGAFGDNLEASGRNLGAAAGLSEDESGRLQSLGEVLNYNAYGESVEDLHFPPLELHRRMAPYADPLAFVAGDGAFEILCRGYAADLEKAASVKAAASEEHAALYRLPDEAWARRVSGAFANRLAREAPQRAHAVMLPNSNGGLSVSVRAPLARPTGASDLCLGFAGGGGREAAAGINHLDAAQAELFARRFLEYFGS